eukprot:90360_1
MSNDRELFVSIVNAAVNQLSAVYNGLETYRAHILEFFKHNAINRDTFRGIHKATFMSCLKQYIFKGTLVEPSTQMMAVFDLLMEYISVIMDGAYPQEHARYGISTSSLPSQQYLSTSSHVPVSLSSDYERAIYRLAQVYLVPSASYRVSTHYRSSQPQLQMSKKNENGNFVMNQPSAQSSSNINHMLMIENIPLHVGDGELKDLFGSFGSVYAETSKGVGFVGFQRCCERLKAMRSMNNKYWYGHKLRMSFIADKRRAKTKHVIPTDVMMGANGGGHTVDVNHNQNHVDVVDIDDEEFNHVMVKKEKEEEKDAIAMQDDIERAKAQSIKDLEANKNANGFVPVASASVVVDDNDFLKFVADGHNQMEPKEPLKMIADDNQNIDTKDMKMNEYSMGALQKPDDIIINQSMDLDAKDANDANQINFIKHDHAANNSQIIHRRSTTTQSKMSTGFEISEINEIDHDIIAPVFDIERDNDKEKEEDLFADDAFPNDGLNDDFDDLRQSDAFFG